MSSTEGKTLTETGASLGSLVVKTSMGNGVGSLELWFSFRIGIRRNIPELGLVGVTPLGMYFFWVNESPEYCPVV